jgi:hypothetical protein
LERQTNIKLLKNEVQLVIFSLPILIFFDNPMVICLNYLVVVSITSFLLLNKKKINPFSFYFILFFIFNIYIIIPVSNYLLFGKPIFLPKVTLGIYQDPLFQYLSKYVKYSTLTVLFFLIIPASKKNGETVRGLRIPFFYALLLFIFGIILLVLQVYVSGAYKYIGNHGFVRQYLFAQPSFYMYFVNLGIYFSFKEIGLKMASKTMSIIVFLLLLFYCFFWVKIGIRGSAFYPLMISVLAFFRTQKPSNFRKFFKKKHLVYLFAVYVGFMYFSIRTRIYNKSGTRKENPTFEDVIDLIKKRPDFLNPGTLEYAASYYNFSVMMHNDFKQEYPLQAYVESLKTLGKPILGYFINYDVGLFYKYRDQFFKERREKLGKSGGTGYSLQYEFYMQGWILMILISFLVILFFNKVSVNVEKKGGLWEIYAVLLFSVLITFPRSSLTLNFFITRFIYSSIIILFLKVIQIDENKNIT